MYIGLWLRLLQIVTDFLKIMEKEKEITIELLISIIYHKLMYSFTEIAS